MKFSDVLGRGISNLSVPCVSFRFSVKLISSLKPDDCVMGPNGASPASYLFL